MENKLPKRLKKEPLLDVLFECRFDAAIPASNVLPGMFFSELEGEKKIERLPHAEIPEVIRNGDPGLQYIPLVRVHAGDFSLLIGDRSVGVSCNLPYKGWPVFKSAILKTMSVLKKTGIVERVNRYSTKYIDLIQADAPEEQAGIANLALRVGSHTLTAEPYQVRLEIPTNGFINVVQVISRAQVTLQDGQILRGVVIDIDTIKNTNDVTLDELEVGLDEALELIHRTGKETFFDCLTPATLSKLEPEYD